MNQRALFEGRIGDEGRSITRHSRDRLTLDLRGIAGGLRGFAAARRMTLAACARQAVEAMLGTETEVAREFPAVESDAIDEPKIKVTLRLPASHAMLLAMRARNAEVSQGEYLAALIEGAPIAPRATDHRELLAALTRSTADLAALRFDLQNVARIWPGGERDAMELRVSVDRLDGAVREHIRMTSRLLADFGCGRRRVPPAKTRGSEP